VLARDVFHCPADDVLEGLTSEQMTEWYAVMNWDKYKGEQPDQQALLEQILGGPVVK
jgi:hypothetical protein